MPLVDDGLGELPLCLRGLPVTPSLNHRRSAKQLCPSLHDLLSAELACSRLIDVHHQVIVVRHHSERRNLDREDRRQLLQSLEHPFLAMRIVASRVLVITPKPCPTHAPGDHVIVRSIGQRDEILARVGMAPPVPRSSHTYIFTPLGRTRVCKYLGVPLEIDACPRGGRGKGSVPQ